jgi:hypothetical protein
LGKTVARRQIELVQGDEGKGKSKLVRCSLLVVGCLLPKVGGKPTEPLCSGFCVKALLPRPVPPVTNKTTNNEQQTTNNEKLTTDVLAIHFPLHPLEQAGEDSAGADLIKTLPAARKQVAHRLFP